jgi:plastocyanin
MARNHLTRRLAPSLTAAALASVAVACGSDDGGLSTGACATTAAYAASTFAAPQDPAAIGPYAETEVLPILDRLVEQTDGAEATAATDLREQIAELASTGDIAIVESSEFRDAESAVGAAVHEQCDVATLDVTAKDYAFEGIAQTVEAGITSLALENVGTEDHEVVLLRRKDDAGDLKLAELFERGEEEAFGLVDFAGVAAGPPGSTAYTQVDLTPGTYFVVCFLPVGGGEDGPPHFTEGMQQTITVQ